MGGNRNWPALSGLTQGEIQAAFEAALAASDAPAKFSLNGSIVPVTEDAGTPSNNAPLPVKLMGAGGTINLTAGDIDVQLSHLGASHDSTRIGDGTTELGITVSGEAKVQDSGAATLLTAIKAAVEGSLTVGLPSGASTSAKQDAAKTVLDSLATLATAGNASLSSIDTKASSLSTSAKQDAAKTVLDSLDAKASPLAGYTSSGNITTVGGTACTLDVNGMSTATIRAGGTFDGLIALQGSVDGTNYQLIPLYNYGSRDAQLYVSTNDHASANIGGYLKVRLIAVVWNSGTANCVLNINSGVGTVAVTSSSPAQLYTTTNLRDGAGSAVNKGQAALAGSLPVAIASDQTTLKVRTGGDSGSYAENTSLTTTAATFTAPANAIGFVIQAPSTNSDSTRFKVGATASSSSGFLMEPGRSETIMIGADVSVASASGTQAMIIQWIVRS